MSQVNATHIANSEIIFILTIQREALAQTIYAIEHHANIANRLARTPGRSPAENVELMTALARIVQLVQSVPGDMEKDFRLNIEKHRAGIAKKDEPEKPQTEPFQFRLIEDDEALPS